MSRILTDDELKFILAEIKNGKKKYVPWLISSVYKYISKCVSNSKGLLKKYGLQIDEVVNEVISHIEHIIDLYDFKENVRFQYYIALWVRHYVNTMIDDESDMNKSSTMIKRSLIANHIMPDRYGMWSMEDIEKVCKKKTACKRFYTDQMNNVISLSDPVHGSEFDGDILYEDLLQYKDQDISFDLKNDLKACLNYLEPDEKYLFINRYKYKKPFRTIAKEMHNYNSNLSQEYEVILNKMKNFLLGDENLSKTRTI
jgi:RNA polymerase sigma factor (sigma-70 family)